VVAIPETLPSDIVVSGNATRNIEKHVDTTIDADVFAFPSNDTDEFITPDLACTETEKQQVIALAQAGIPRREILKRMRWSASKYGIIKQVLDQEGF